MSEGKATALPEGDGRYMIVNIVARRARVINREKLNTMYEQNSPDPLDVAMNEYKNNLLEFEFRSHMIGAGEDYRSA